MQEREMQIKFELKQGQRGVPVKLFNEVVGSLQRSLYYMGEYLIFAEGSERSRGPIPDEVIKTCTLEVRSVGTASVSAQLVLIEQSLRLFPDNKGEKSLEKLMGLIENVSVDNINEVKHIVEDKSVRNKILRTLSNLDPRNYPIKEVNLVSMGKTIGVKSGWVEKTNRIVVGPITEEVEIIGPIVELRIIPSRYFGILYEGKSIKCPLEEDLQDIVISTISNVAKIEGLGNLDAQGRIKEMTNIFNITPLETNIFPVASLDWKERTFYFSDKLECKISYEEGLWEIKSEDLNILVYGENFDRAWKSFREDIAFLWDEYALAEDKGLSEKARELKNKVRAIIENVQIHD